MSAAESTDLLPTSTSSTRTAAASLTPAGTHHSSRRVTDLSTAEPLQLVTNGDKTMIKAPPPPDIINNEHDDAADDAAAAAAAAMTVPYWQLFRYADALDLLCMALGSLSAACSGAAFPVFMLLLSGLLDSFGTLATSDPDKMAREVNKYALYLVYLSAVAFFTSYGEVFFWMWTGERQSSRVRLLYMRAILRQDVAFFEAEKEAKGLVGRVASDTLLLQDAMGEKVGSFIKNVVLFIAGFGVAYYQVWQIALAMTAFIPIIALPGALYAKALTSLSSAESAAYQVAGSIAEQAIAAIRTVYSFVGETKTLSAYSAALEGSFNLGKKQGFAKGLALGSNGFTFAIWAFMFWLGGKLVISGDANGGEVLATAFNVILGGVGLGQALPYLKAFALGQTAAARIFAIVGRKPGIDAEDLSGQEVKGVKGQLELRGVKFSYPARPDAVVFEDFSLTIPAGKTVALVGASGSGKSTVIGLLQRFYDPLAGSVFVDGVDIRSLQLKSLRSFMGLVSQEPALFAASIVDNIRYGKHDATQEEVEMAAKAANAFDFISKLPDGFGTQVGQRGVQLSGGQKQRIAIARALIKSPPILLLDEATSALDSESERVVQAALDRAASGRTTVVVAHRLSTIRHADVIAVVVSGQVVEQGSHDELISKPDGAYAALVSIQNKRYSSDEAEPAAESPAPGSSVAANVTSSAGSLGHHQQQQQQPGIQLQDSNLSVASADSGMSLRLTASKAAVGSEQEQQASSSSSSSSSKKKKKPSYKRLLALNRPEWPYAVIGTIGGCAVGAVYPVWSYSVAFLIGSFYSGSASTIRKDVFKFAMVFVAVGVFSFIANLVEHFYYGLMGEHLTRRVREQMLAAILRQDMGWFDKDENSSGALATKLSADASKLRALVGDRMSILVQAASGVVIAFAIGFALQWKLTLVMMATLPLLIASFIMEAVLLFGFSSQTTKAQEQASSVAQEAVANHRTVLSLCAEDRVLELYASKLRGPQRASWIRGNLAGVGLGISQFVLYASWALALWYGSTLSKKGEASFNDVFEVFLVIISVGFAIAEAASLAPDVAKGSHAVASVFSILDMKPRIAADDPAAKTPEQLQGAITLHDVKFAYPSRPDVVVFNGFNLKVKAGQTVALVGESGSGKSTIIGLLERFYDPLEGRVMIDNIDIRTVNLRWLRRHIGLVQQEPVLFATSIRENIAYGAQSAEDAAQYAAEGPRKSGNETSYEPMESEIIEAAKAANAHNFISGLPDGYDTYCGDRGLQLSGGQKQRVAIARAVLKNPRILLLDEATSALDAESEKVVQTALDRIMVGRTTVIVAHRLSTIRNADVIAVLHAGQIVEQGSHDELMAKGEGGAYFSLVKLQSK